MEIILFSKRVHCFLSQDQLIITYNIESFLGRSRNDLLFEIKLIKKSKPTSKEKQERTQ